MPNICLTYAKPIPVPKSWKASHFVSLRAWGLPHYPERGLGLGWFFGLQRFGFQDRAVWPKPLLVDDSFGDYTTSIEESRTKPLKWNERGILNTAHIATWVDLHGEMAFFGGGLHPFREAQQHYSSLRYFTASKFGFRMSCHQLEKVAILQQRVTKICETVSQSCHFIF